MMMDAVRANRRPSQIITRKALENTIASVAASGGSTNAVLHLIAIAQEMGIPLSVDDFDAISKRTPFICDLSPAGKYMASHFQAAGGSRLLAKRLIDAGFADGSTLDHQRQDAGGRSGAGAGNARPGGHPHVRASPSSPPAGS